MGSNTHGLHAKKGNMLFVLNMDVIKVSDRLRKPAYIDRVND
jgi:hypothetical protein